MGAVCGRRGGKTVTALTDVISQIVIPKSRVAVFEPTRDQCLEVFVEPFLDMIPSNWISSYNKSNLKFRFANGSQLKLYSGEAFERLRGVDAHRVVIDEFQEQNFAMIEKTIMPTLTKVKGDLRIFGTPKPEAHEWRDYLMSDNVSLHQWTTAQGKLIDATELEYFKSIMDERSYRQEFEAEWLEIGGQIAYNFTKESVVDVAFEPSAKTWVSYDFNVNPMTAVIVQERDGKSFVIQDFQIPQSNTEHATNVISEWLKSNGKKDGEIFVTGDYAGNSRSTKGGGVTDFLLIEQVLKRHGFDVDLNWIRTTKRVEDRHLLLNVGFKRANGDRTLFVNSVCKYVRKSLERLTRLDFTKGDPKGLTHIYDALSYYAYNRLAIDNNIW